MTINYQLPETDKEKIRSIPHFQSSIYHDLDISATLNFFFRRYVAPIGKFIDISDSTVIDCGAGYGWFTFAYLLAGGKKVIAIDIDERRLEASFDIAKILGMDNRIDYLVSPIHSIPLSRNFADFIVSIETLEHVGKDLIKPSLYRLKEIASKGCLLTTPNKYFPVIAHDTRLPFAHWLPYNVRKIYSSLFGREEMNEKNDFLSPLDLVILFDKFKPATKCLTFDSFSDFYNHYPFYLPYGPEENNRWQRKPSSFKSGYYRFASLVFGVNSFWVMPNMAHIFTRHNN